MPLPHQRFHINGKGEPGVCSALIKCRFGGQDNHYPTSEAARAAFEVKMGAGLVAPPLLPDKLSYEEKQTRLHDLFTSRLPERPENGYEDIVYEEETGEDVALMARSDLLPLLRRARQVADENPWRDVGVGDAVHHNMFVATRMGQAVKAGEYLRARAAEAKSDEARAFYTVIADQLSESDGMLF